MRLLYYANKARIKTDNGWDFPEWFPVPQAQIMEDLGIKDKHKLYKIRTELISAGFVEMSKSKGRELPRYHLTVLKTETSAVFSVNKKQGSFDTDDFFLASVKKSFGDDFDPRILEK